MYGSSVDRKVYRIGAWGEWTLAEARDEARKIRRAFYDHGVDPTRAKKKRIQTGKSRLTVEELVDEYLKAKEAVWADSYMTSNKKVHAKRLVDAYGGQYAEDLRKDDVARVFLEIKKNFPSQAHLFRVFGRGCYNWALDWKRVPEMPNPFVLERGHSSAKSDFKIPPKKRARHLRHKRGEATALFDLLRDQPEDAKFYLVAAKLYLLTGFRKTELLKARWEHIDHKLRTLQNVKPKGGRDNSYDMPLTDMAYELLESLGDGHIKFRKGPIFRGQGETRKETPSLFPRGSGGMG